MQEDIGMLEDTGVLEDIQVLLQENNLTLEEDKPAMGTVLKHVSCFKHNMRCTCEGYPAVA